MTPPDRDLTLEERVLQLEIKQDVADGRLQRIERAIGRVFWTVIVAIVGGAASFIALLVGSGFLHWIKNGLENT